MEVVVCVVYTFFYHRNAHLNANATGLVEDVCGTGPRGPSVPDSPPPIAFDLLALGNPSSIVSSQHDETLPA